MFRVLFERQTLTKEKRINKTGQEVENCPTAVWVALGLVVVCSDWSVHPSPSASQRFPRIKKSVSGQNFTEENMTVFEMNLISHDAMNVCSLW